MKYLIRGLAVASISALQAASADTFTVHNMDDGKSVTGRINMMVESDPPFREVRVTVDGVPANAEQIRYYPRGVTGKRADVAFDVNYLPPGSHRLGLRVDYPGRTESRRFTFFTGQAPATAPRLAAAPARNGAAPAAAPGRSDLPMLREWEEKMRYWGRVHCYDVQDGLLGGDLALGATYYDAEWVFRQIADYTGDPFFVDCARAARVVYRDRYVLPVNGIVPGYWNFTQGLTDGAIREGDPASKAAVLLLAEAASYAADYVPKAWMLDASTSREVAYAIVSYLDAERLGAPRRAKLSVLVDLSLDYLSQWFRGGNRLVKPFMVGLTARSLVKYAEATGDRRVLPALKAALADLWRKTWVPEEQAFRYADRAAEADGTAAAADLNLLIAPAYMWVYASTGDESFRRMADRIFASGVRKAYFEGPKQFNQNYLWSIDLVRWREAGRAVAE